MSHSLLKALSLPPERKLPAASREAREELLVIVEERALIERMAVRSMMIEDTELGELVYKYRDSFRFPVRLKLLDYRVEAAAIKVLSIDDPKGLQKSELRMIQSAIANLEKTLPRIPAEAVTTWVRLMEHSNPPLTWRDLSR